MPSLPASHSTSGSSSSSLCGGLRDLSFCSAISSSGCSKRCVRERAIRSRVGGRIRPSATISFRMSSSRSRRSAGAARAAGRCAARFAAGAPGSSGIGSGHARHFTLSAALVIAVAHADHRRNHDRSAANVDITTLARRRDRQRGEHDAAGRRRRRRRDPPRRRARSCSPSAGRSAAARPAMRGSRAAIGCRRAT